MKQFVLASSNSGKLAELKSILKPLGYEPTPQQDWAVPEAIEDGKSFLENALIKARNAAAHTGLPALGDDSGIVVAALDGKPGIYSARFAGENATAVDNNNKLLHQLQDVPPELRQAFFYCAMVFVVTPEDPAPLVATGQWHGQILLSPRGEGGFGYDPLFEVEALKKTAAELEPEFKNQISHRGLALQSITAQLKGSEPILPEELPGCGQADKIGSDPF